jgi:hypothetical protein
MLLLQWGATEENVVLACSALKHSYDESAPGGAICVHKGDAAANDRLRS